MFSPSCNKVARPSLKLCHHAPLKLCPLAQSHFSPKQHLLPPTSRCPLPSPCLHTPMLRPRSPTPQITTPSPALTRTRTMATSHGHQRGNRSSSDRRRPCQPLQRRRRNIGATQLPFPRLSCQHAHGPLADRERKQQPQQPRCRHPSHTGIAWIVRPRHKRWCQRPA